ncbi:MAG: hypothetical protein ACK6AD_11845, partial [Cyanobacteriota bacterium]
MPPPPSAPGKRCAPNLPGSLTRSLSCRLRVDATTAMRVALLYGDMEWLASGASQVRYSASDYARRQGMHRNTIHADIKRLAAIGAIRLDCDRANSITVDLLGLFPTEQDPEALAFPSGNPCSQEQQALPPSTASSLPFGAATPCWPDEPPVAHDHSNPCFPEQQGLPTTTATPLLVGTATPCWADEPPHVHQGSNPLLHGAATIEKGFKTLEKGITGRREEAHQQQATDSPDVQQEPIQGQEDPGASDGAVASPLGEASEPEPLQGRETWSAERLAASRSPGLNQAPSRPNLASPSRPCSQRKPLAEPEVAASQASAGRTAGPASARAAGQGPGTASHRPNSASHGPGIAEPALSPHNEPTASPETSAALLDRLLGAYRASKPAEWPSPSALTLTPGRKGKLQAALRYAGGTDALVRRVEAALAHVPPWYRATYPVRPDGSRRPAHQFFDVLFRATGDEREGGLEAWHVFSWSEAGSREPLAASGDRLGPSGGSRGGGLTGSGAPAETPPETDLERARRLFIWDTPSWRLRAIEAYELPMSERRRLIGLLEALGD